MTKTLWVVVASASLATLASLAAEQPAQQGKRTVQNELGSDRFAAGCPVRVVLPVAGDLLAAGCDVEASAAVNGDAVLAGGNVRLDANVGNGVYAAGGKVTVNAAVGRNVRMAGGHVEIGPNAKVAGNVTVAGGDVAIRGAVKGSLLAGGGRVLIDGAVDGDVTAGADHLELGPNARIGGKLTYGSKDFQRDPAAQVTGAVVVRESHREDREEAPAWRRRAGGGWIWSAGVMLMAALLAAAMPVVSARLAQELRAHPGLVLLWGFIAFVCIPVGAVLLMITIIGIPIALLAILLYLALLLAGYAVTAAGIADLALRRYRPEAAARVAWRAGAAILAALALALLARVPLLGGLVVLVAMLAGIGAIAALLFHRAEAG